MRQTFQRLLRGYSHILNKHKYATQIITGGILWLSGDLLCQGLVQLGSSPELAEPGKSSNDKIISNKRKEFHIDWNRTMRMTIYGLCFSAPSYAFWYTALEKYSQRFFASQPPGTSLALPGWLRRLPKNTLTNPLINILNSSDGASHLRTWKIIGFKLAMDTFIFDPIYLSLFFTVTSTMEGASYSQVLSKLRRELAHTWLVDIAVWTPIQTINFRFVPVLYQALVVQSCNIGWNAYLSFVQHRHAKNT